MIYFLRAGPAIKIGYSGSPAAAIRRLTGFQTANAQNLQLLGVAEGDRKQEAALHRRFSAYHLRGEWFAADQELLTVIGDLSQPQESFSMAPPMPTEIAGVAFTTLNPTAAPPLRLSSSFRGLDAVLGGGFTAGSTTLLSGDPGAGKSTLLLQVAAYVACRGYTAVYATAEEAEAQVQLRAARLGLAAAPARLAATNDVAALIAALDTPATAPTFLVVDSLQRFVDPACPALVAGSPSQTHAVLAALIAHAHRRQTITVVVSHVNKARQASGTNDLQHDVDVLLHLHALNDRRVLRAIKNRYGPTDVAATFRMTQAGIVEAR